MPAPSCRYPLAERSPLLDAPDCKAPNRLLEKGQVIGYQEKAQGQHPESQKGQDGEDAAEDEQNSCRQPDPSCLRMPEVAQDAGDLPWHFVLQVSEGLSQNCSSALMPHDSERLLMGGGSGKPRLRNRLPRLTYRTSPERASATAFLPCSRIRLRREACSERARRSRWGMNSSGRAGSPKYCGLSLLSK